MTLVLKTLQEQKQEKDIIAHDSQNVYFIIWTYKKDNFCPLLLIYDCYPTFIHPILSLKCQVDK